MIDIEKVEKLARERLEKGMFLVEVTVSKSNAISVFVDGMDGVTIDQCIAISRNIEFNLDREVEDFELQVSSAGLGRPFKVIEQYTKSLGEKIEVLSNDGNKLVGILKEVDDNYIKLETTRKEKVEGRKKKELVVEVLTLNFEEIKSAKNIILFN